jgi:hypothetical protein
MLDIITQVMQDESLLDNNSEWNSLDITYEPPHVERVWRQWGEYRVYLHRISRCTTDQALWHPHPWPSVVHIASGSYEMGVANGYKFPASGTIDPLKNELACKLILPTGTYYEMLEPMGWHYVRPLETVMSIMVTGKPWQNAYQPQKEKHVPQELNMVEKISILSWFKNYL